MFEICLKLFLFIIFNSIMFNPLFTPEALSLKANSSDFSATLNYERPVTLGLYQKSFLGVIPANAGIP